MTVKHLLLKSKKNLFLAQSISAKHSNKIPSNPSQGFISSQEAEPLRAAAPAVPNKHRLTINKSSRRNPIKLNKAKM